jgi:hypothetical protein
MNCNYYAQKKLEICRSTAFQEVSHKVGKA